MQNRDRDIQRILNFVAENRNSYASLAVCRRAIDSGLGEITDPVIHMLQEHLAEAPSDEIAAYYSIVM